MKLSRLEEEVFYDLTHRVFHEVREDYNILAVYHPKLYVYTFIGEDKNIQKALDHVNEFLS